MPDTASGPEPDRRPVLLVVTHSRAGGTAAMAEAVLEGATDPAVSGVQVRHLEAPEAGPEDVRAAGAVLVGTPERLGSMAGLVKDFFERIYYPCLDETRGLPYALFVRATTGGAGAPASVEPIVTGLGWNPIRPPLVVIGDLTSEARDECVELGAMVAAGLEAGIL